MFRHWLKKSLSPQPSLDPGMMGFTCNLCGSLAMAPFDQVSAREVVSCPCGATLRFRSVVSALTERLLGDGSLLLNRMPPQKQFIGFGMSDAAVYGNLLEQTFSYTNTYYHKEPHLDITDPPAALLGKHDFIISSDVMEHVARPVDNAFRHLAELLKPGGVLVLTVPFATEGSTIEHFPELFEYKIVGEGADQQLINRTRDGREQCFDNLVFHGDDGATLEMRLFSRDDLIRLLQGAGFSDVRIHSRPIPSIGVIQIEPFSLPITAIKRR